MIKKSSKCNLFQYNVSQLMHFLNFLNVFLKLLKYRLTKKLEERREEKRKEEEQVN